MTIPTWTPVNNTVSAITNANPGLVTTASAHGYFSGAYVRFYFPVNYGMQQVNGNVYLIKVLSPTTFSINQDTTLFDPFNNANTSQVPQVVPVGEVATTLVNLEENTLTPIGGGI